MRTNILSVASVLFVFGLACGDSGSGGSDTGGSGGSGAAGAAGGGGAAGGDGGSGATGAAGGDGGSGGGAMVNGCSRATATEVDGDADLMWSLTHQECTAIAVGASVTWTGDFGFHPLAGGVAGTADAGSPISTSDQTGASATVTFAEAGEYPYFCMVHGASMQGVIYVE